MAGDPNRPDADEELPDTAVEGASFERSPPSEQLPAAPTVEHSALGRYIIIGELGQGGMARVYRAYDPKLHREIALKVLSLERMDDAEARGRTLREAQAMARLSHPNVVPVYDVEPDGHTLFIAMEYVAGTTLRAWCREHRDWREILSVFQQAGRGLAAAHATDVVHRDFKPTNVMVGEDGRVRVMDFGLAALSLVTAPTESVHPSGSASLLTAELTRTGVTMGTPPYMSPEQHTGEPVDARSDQFSFCVALYEALYGQRPFSGRSLTSLLEHKFRGPSPFPDSPRVPLRVRRALARGLSATPDQRFPTMNALLDATGTHARSSRRWLFAGATLAATTVAGTTAYVRAQRAELCTGAEPRVRPVWNETRRVRLREALLATNVSYADLTATQSIARFDDWTDRWIDRRRETCEATTIRGEQSDHAMELRNACLDRRLHQVDSLLALLEVPDPSLAERAVELSSDLPRLETCHDLDALRAATPPPDDPLVAEQVEELRDEHDRAVALHRVGRYAEASAQFEQQLRRAEVLSYEPLLGQLHTSLGISQLDEDRVDSARQHLERGYELALGSRNDEVALDAALKLFFLLGSRSGHYEQAGIWRVASRGLVHRLGDRPWHRAQLRSQDAEEAMKSENAPRAAAALRETLQLLLQIREPVDVDVGMVHLNLGSVLFRDHQLPAALEQVEQARVIFEQLLGPTHPYSLYAYNHLGVINAFLGDYAAAERHHRQALDGRIIALGPQHANVAVSHTNLAMTLQEQQRYDEAAEHHRKAIAITEHARGERSPTLVPLLNNLAGLQRLQGHLEPALVTHRRALELSTDESSPPDAVRSRLGVAILLDELGQDDEALRLYTEALERARAMESPDPVLVADAQRSRANLFVRQGKLALAERELKEALTAMEAAVAGNDLRLGFTLDSYGECLRRQHRPSEAIAPLERALAIWLERPVDAIQRAKTRVSLAKALHELAREPARVRQLAAAAGHDLEEAPPSSQRAEARDDLRDWGRASGIPSPGSPPW